MMLGFQWAREQLTRKGSYSREVAGTFGTNLAIAALNMCSGILLARLLGPAGRGELAAIQALPTIVSAFGMLGLFDAVIYFGGRDPKRMPTYATSAAAAVLPFGGPLVIGAVLLSPIFLRVQSDDVIFASQVYLCLLFVNALHGVPIHIARAGHHIGLWNRLRLFSPLLWLLIVFSFFVPGRAIPEGIAFAHLGGFAVLSATLLVPVRKYLRTGWKPRPSLWPSMLKYGLPVAVGAAPNVMSQRLDQLVIAGLLAPQELGLYAVAVSWAALGMLPANALIGVAFSKIATMSDRERQIAFVRKATVAVLGTVGSTTIALALLAPLAIPLAFGREFAPAWPIAVVLLAGTVTRATARMLQVGMKALGKPTVVMYSEWSGLAVLAVGLALLLSPYGAVGAAAASVGSAATACLAALFLTRRATRRITPQQPDAVG